MSKGAIIATIIISCLFVLGAGLVSWYSEYININKEWKLHWDAGVRDADVAVVLLCAYDTSHNTENPNWFTAIRKSEQPALFPEPVGTSVQVFYNITDVVASLPDGVLTFAAAYVDESGNMSEWTTVVKVFDKTAPPAPVAFGVSM